MQVQNRIANAGTFTQAGQSEATPVINGSVNLHATIVGTGSLAAVAKVQGSNNPKNPNSWIDIGVQVTLSGTNSATGSASAETTFAYHRIVVVSMSAGSSLHAATSGYERTPDGQPVGGGELAAVTGGGDSFTARMHQAIFPSSAATCSNGVVTVPANNHGLSTGGLVNATGAAQEAANVVRAPITRINANSFSYPAPGCPDGNITNGAASFQVTSWTQSTLESVFEHLNGVAGGGLRLVQNAGHSGYLMQAVLDRYATVLAPFASDLHIHWGYFNDMNQGVSAEASCATVQEMLRRKAAAGSLCAVMSALPVPSTIGSWSTAGGINGTPASQAAWAVQWNVAMRAFCEANGMLFVDVYSRSAGNNGFALPGVLKANDIHPAYRTVRMGGRLLWQQLRSLGYRAAPRLLSAMNIATDAAARNIIRAAPSEIGAGGTAGTGVTGTYTAWAAGTIAANSWRTSNGGLYFTPGGGTATAGNAPTHTRGTVTTADGISWMFVGRASGEAGIPALWGVYGGATCFVHSSLQDRPEGGRALRAISVAGAANDQVRVSYLGGNADVTPGQTVSSAIRVSLDTSFNGVGASPYGQNVRVITAQYVVTVDGVTYIFFGRRGGVGAANEMQTDGMEDEVFTVDNCLIPQGNLTLSRWDVLQQYAAAGAAAITVDTLTSTR